MIRPHERLWLVLACIVITLLLRPAKRLYPRFWKQWFGSMLCGAAYVGSVRMLRWLLWLHPDMEAGEPIAQSTSLMAAATMGHLAVVRYLLTRGANVNACNAWGETALMRSAGRDNLELTNLLLESGAEVNARTKHGETAFIEAAKTGQTSTMQLLLDRGADMLASGPGHMDALIWSSALGQTRNVEFLLEQGMSAEGKRGKSALRMAMRHEYSQIVFLLRQAGASDLS